MKTGHLEHLCIANAKNLSCSAWDFAAGDDAIRKWTVLPPRTESKELFAYIALACAGILVLQGVEEWCPCGQLPCFLSLMDSIFPNLQFLVALSEAGTRAIPSPLLAKTLPVPRPLPCPPRAVPTRLPLDTVLLVDVDSQLPNLALMKLSRHFKNQGQRVVLTRGDARTLHAEAVYASCVFAFPESGRRVERLRQHYGAALRVGGSGVDAG